MSANWRPPVHAGEGRGEAVRRPPGLHLRLLVLTSECRSCRPAAGGFGVLPPLARASPCRRPVALRGRPGNPSVRELRQETEAAGFIGGLARPREIGDRISRPERPVAESLPGSAAGDPGVLPVNGTDPLGRSRQRRQPGRRSEPAALRPRRVRAFGSTPGRRGICGGTPADFIDSVEETRRAGRVRQCRETLTRSAPPVIGEIGCRSLTPNGGARFFRLVNARCGHASTVLTSNEGPRAPGGDPARRGDGRRARGPAAAPPSHRQQLRQQLPDAASDGVLEGRPTHGLEGRGRRGRPAERGIAESRGAGPRSVRVSMATDGEALLVPCTRQLEHCEGRGGMPEGLVRQEARGRARRERGPQVWRDDGRATVCGSGPAFRNPV